MLAAFFALAFFLNGIETPECQKEIRLIAQKAVLLVSRRRKGFLLQRLMKKENNIYPSA